MMGILHRILIALAWRMDHTDNHWRYEENGVTGDRRAVRFNYLRGWPAAPADQDWLNRWPAGEWRRRNPPPGRPTC